MRHRNRGRKLGVSPAHRKAMGRNMIQALIDHERIVTTVEKAKQFQPLAEKVIHLGKVDNLNNVRRAVQLAGNRKLENEVTTTESTGEGKEKVTKVRVVARTTVQKLFRDIGPRNKDRDGGYTRIIRMARTRVGDNASQCIFELTASPWTKVEKA
ncbi:MAG: 50S ribosomal protein L17 [Planctomycetes bacterium]|jgi:large subunit ribosomal protein L17|nr:50S ribosomal protein L17 [Planctomycetota bacterium]